MDSKIGLELTPIENSIVAIEHIKKDNPDLKDLDINDFIQYRTCCSNSSKGFINYMSKLLISILIITFCVFMIVNSEEGTDNSIHYSLLSSIMSVYVQPYHHDDKN